MIHAALTRCILFAGCTRASCNRLEGAAECHGASSRTRGKHLVPCRHFTHRICATTQAYQSCHCTRDALRRICPARTSTLAAPSAQFACTCTLGESSCHQLIRGDSLLRLHCTIAILLISDRNEQPTVSSRHTRMLDACTFGTLWCSAV
jgi:hypothetical protein